MQVSRISAGRFVIFFVGNSSLKGQTTVTFSTHNNNYSLYLFILACIVSNSETIKVADTTINPILQMRKWRLREVKSITTETTNKTSPNPDSALGGVGVSDFIFTPRGSVKPTPVLQGTQGSAHYVTGGGR